MTGVITGRTVARSAHVLFARVVGANAAVITQGTIDSIAYQVRDLDGEISGSEAALVVADTVFDTLQTGNGWDADTTGYNFRAIIPASAFSWTPEADVAGNPRPRRFRVDVRFTPTDGEPWVVPFALFVTPVWIALP